MAKAHAQDDRAPKGMFSAVDIHDLPPGAMAEQINMTCIRPGAWRVRSGMRRLVFDNGSFTNGASPSVIAAFSVTGPNGPFIIHELSNGSLAVGRQPT